MHLRKQSCNIVVPDLSALFTLSNTFYFVLSVVLMVTIKVGIRSYSSSNYHKGNGVGSTYLCRCYLS